MDDIFLHLRTVLKSLDLVRRSFLEDYTPFSGGF